MEPVDTQNLFTSYQGMDQLKALARKDDGQALKQVAQQFEAIFMQMMLKSMRDASMGDELFDSSEMDFYQELMDQQVSMQLSQTEGRGLGLADVIMRQLSAAPSGLDKPTMLGMQQAMMRGQVSAISDSAPIKTQQLEPASELSSASESSSAGEFVRSLWPLAESAAGQLGLPPGILIAQAAVETAWGRNVIQNEKHGSSFNLFNIKADSLWQGASSTQATTAFENGMALKRWDPYRVYDSFADSFQDYVSVIQANPVYAPALSHDGNPYHYIKQLHRSGYASDPEYSNKIIEIYENEILPRQPGSVKDS